MSNVPSASLLGRRPRRTSDAGFTLIELLVVVMIVGVLAGIAIPAFLTARTNAKDGVLQSDLANAKTATIAWAAVKDADALPAIGTQLVEWGYASSGYVGAGVAPAYKEGSTARLFCIVGTSESTQQFSVTTHGGVRRGFCPFSTSEW